MRIRSLVTGLVVLVAAPTFGPATVAHAEADSCATGVMSDFNGDGWSDAVVSDPFATVGGLAEAGRIIVLYGDSDDLVGEGARDVLWQGEEAVGGVAEAGDRFGTALAVADLDCDDYTDLVVGTPLEDISGQADSGYVQVLWGGASGLAITQASAVYTQSTFGHTITAGDQFGYAVDAVEDLGQGGTPAPDAFALAIGVPGADVGGHNNAGALAVAAAYDGGNVTFWLTQDTPNLPGGAETGDRFGAAVSCNYLTGEGDAIDCVVGTPNEDIGSRADAGAATLVQDIYFDDNMVGISLDQNASGVPNSAESGDRYGSSVDTIRVGNTTRIAIGAPGEDLGSDTNAGLVQLFSSDTEDVDPGTALSQDTAGVGGSAEDGDEFGTAVAWIAPGLGDSRTRLAVGVPKENTSGGADAGIVQVFPTINLASDVSWSQATSGVPGGVDAGDKFGASVNTVAGAGERVLLVGVPDDVDHASGMVNVIPFGAGTPRAWVPGGAIPTAGASRFGQSLGGVNGSSE